MPQGRSPTASTSTQVPVDLAAYRAALRGDPAFVDRPFLRWRHQLHAWRLAMAGGWTDAAFIGLVERIERELARLGQIGFRVTPLVATANLHIKDEARGSLGVPEARHIFGDLLALDARGVARDRPLTMAPRPATALAAAFLAAAARRVLELHLPASTDPAIVKSLSHLGATTVLCPPRAGFTEDPCLVAQRDAVRAGAMPFPCQGAADGFFGSGAETLGWEILDQLDGLEIVHIVVPLDGLLALSLGRVLAQAQAVKAIAAIPRIHVTSRPGDPLTHHYEQLTQDLDTTLGLAPAAPRVDDASAAAVAFRLRRADRLAAELSSPLIQRALRWAETHARARPNASDARPSGCLDDLMVRDATVRVMLETGGIPVIPGRLEPTRAAWANDQTVVVTG